MTASVDATSRREPVAREVQLLQCTGQVTDTNVYSIALQSLMTDHCTLCTRQGWPTGERRRRDNYWIHRCNLHGPNLHDGVDQIHQLLAQVHALVKAYHPQICDYQCPNRQYVKPKFKPKTMSPLCLLLNRVLYACELGSYFWVHVVLEEGAIQLTRLLEVCRQGWYDAPPGQTWWTEAEAILTPLLHQLDFLVRVGLYAYRLLETDHYGLEEPEPLE